MSPIDFINRIRYNDDDLCNELSHVSSGAVTGDDESQLEREIEAEIQEEANDDEVAKEKSILDELDDLEPTKEGACLTCLENMACVVFLNCAHNAICSPCFVMFKELHEKRVRKEFKHNARKMERELTIYKCPKCNEVADKAIEIRGNSFT